MLFLFKLDMDELQDQSRWKGNDKKPIGSNSESCPKHQMGKEHEQFRRLKEKKTGAESQEFNIFPADGYRAILKMTGKQKADNRLQNNHNRSITLERSVINKLLESTCTQSLPWILQWFVTYRFNSDKKRN